MIELPRRSVTRFFIPLIDVLTLLFCIFLLMPYVSQAEDELPGNPAATVPGEAQAGEVESLRRQVELLRRDVQVERDARQQALGRLVVRVLEIDRDNGRLYYRDPDRYEITSEADALALIEQERRRTAGRDLYFLFLMPRESGGFPLRRQMTAYEKWFRDVPHGVDSPANRL